MTREEERRKRLREAARRVFDEYNLGGGRKVAKSKTKAVEMVNLKTFYPDSACSVCGKPIERTGKPGRPPTKCLEHR
jgi:hypothetical protein